MLETAISHDITISGEVQGDVHVAPGTRLTITDQGSVHGTIVVSAGATAIIEGEVQGDLVANGNVHVSPNASIHGDITGERS